MVPMDNNENSVKKGGSLQENKVKETKIDKGQFLVYLGLVSVPFGILVSLVFCSILEYSRWPIYTETNVTPQSESNFPAITFCPAHSGYKENILMVSS